MNEPRPLYSERLAQRRAEIARREERHKLLGHGRLALAVAAAAVVWLALASKALSIVWALVPGAAFVALVVVHERLLAERDRLSRAARYWERGLARLDGQWTGMGEPGDRYL